MKKFISIILALLIVFTLSGCDDKSEYLEWEQDGIKYACWEEQPTFGSWTQKCSINGEVLDLAYKEYSEIRGRFDLDDFVLELTKPVEPIIEYVEVVVIEYVEVPIIITENEIEIIYIEIPCEECETTLIAIATHQDYLDWIEEYEELIDGFVDELYSIADDAWDLAYNYNRYLQDKLNNGTSLDSVEVEFMLEFQQYEQTVDDFYLLLNGDIEDQYNELMNRFPQEEGEIE